MTVQSWPYLLDFDQDLIDRVDRLLKQTHQKGGWHESVKMLQTAARFNRSFKRTRHQASASLLDSRNGSRGDP